MLVFDEKKYAEEIINNKKYSTIKTQGRERCILVRYLTSLGYNVDEIKNVLSEIPMSGGEYLSDRDKNIIFSKIISKANEYEFITNITIKIYKSELDIIQTVEDDYSRNLLFIYLSFSSSCSICLPTKTPSISSFGNPNIIADSLSVVSGVLLNLSSRNFS